MQFLIKQMSKKIKEKLLDNLNKQFFIFFFQQTTNDSLHIKANTCRKWNDFINEHYTLQDSYFTHKKKIANKIPYYIPTDQQILIIYISGYFAKLGTAM